MIGGSFNIAANDMLAAVNFNNMKVKDLISELQKHDPEKEVMIQQGEEYDYMLAYSVKTMELCNMTDIYKDDNARDETIEAVVIEYS